ncbi:MAG: MFS transporter [Deltaproteobacteria bacterium]|nr:MFS transporter [Deltaproteobacteria bacterium]
MAAPLAPSSSEPSNAYRWYSVGILALIYASSSVDRQIMGILLQPIKNELGASDTQMGFLVGLTFALFYATLGMPIAMFADRNNRRNVIAAAISVWSIMTVACGFVTNFWQMALARMGVATGEAGSTPASHSMISDLFGPHERASALALFSVGANVGLLISYLGGGWMVDNIGWRSAFYVVGLPGLLIAGILLLTVREPARGAKEAALRDVEPVSFGETVSFMFRHPAIRHIVFGKALGGFVSYGLILWVPAFLARSHGISATRVGFTLAMVLGVGGAIGTLLSGRIVDALGRRDPRWRVWAIAISNIAPLPLSIGFLVVDDFNLAIGLYVLPAMFGAFYIAPSAALIQQLVDVRMRALASAISMFMTNMIGMGLGPQGVGIMSDLLEPHFGTDSLRWALVIFLFVNVWGALHFVLAGRHLKNSHA